MQTLRGLHEHGYLSMPPIDEMYADYLEAGQALTLKAPALPFYGRKYTAASHTALHAGLDQYSNLVYQQS